MDNNTDMNELIKRAQDMIKNNQIPDEVKDIVSNMTSNNDNQNNAISNTGLSNSSRPNRGNGGGGESPNIDMAKLSSLIAKLNSQTSDDDMSRLLFALKPYLRNQKKEKVDEYVKLIRMGKMAQLFDVLGGDNK